VIKMELLLGIVAFALWVICLVDAIGSSSDRIRSLPKATWVVIILLFPLVGSILWLAVGRPDHGAARRSPHERARSTFPEYDRAAARPLPTRSRTPSSCARCASAPRRSARRTTSRRSPSAKPTTAGVRDSCSLRFHHGLRSNPRFPW
jgi:hypothetical protein